MVVYGLVIPQTAIDAAVAYMKENASFTSLDIERILIRYGVPQRKGYNFVAYRAVDRIIQQRRRAGDIVYCRDKSIWKWEGRR